MRNAIKTLLLSIVMSVAACAFGFAGDASPKPTIVLVHGAFAESSSWNHVIDELNKDGYKTIATANPLRGVVNDGAAVASYLRSVPGPVILVGHSYGGPVITEAANDSPNVKALVYVAAFAPDVGESSSSLSSKFPGSTLPKTLNTVALPDGNRDLYIRPDLFHDQFAADVPQPISEQMAVTQRPVTEAALAEPTKRASWKLLPSYAIYGARDLCIPPAVMSFMAKRAHARKTVVLDGASHALIVSRPKEVVSIIEQAARESQEATPVHGSN
ncbi:alpha/beta hydrolase [Agrobacterium sp. Ap1]|uniref:alpha/beta fold hydrolase n=1 Tax=Rhizobium/Agrobacterium group TaxID=227290 RepID=UPI001A902367|nr:alpha/beta hydrolase [Agrobacterium sp. Ap1]MBO0144579.1 alpha/beta hydrolase [Agrobacterium sp. Ap1]